MSSRNVDARAEQSPPRQTDQAVERVYWAVRTLRKLGFEGIEPEATGRPAYHPSVLLKIYIYGYLNRIQSSRRLEREPHKVRTYHVQQLRDRVE